MRIDQETTEAFRLYLQERERSVATVTKYLHDVELLASFCGGAVEDKSTLIAYKQHLQERGYAPASVNSMLAAVNAYLAFAGQPGWRLRYLKVQRTNFSGKEKELTQQEYCRLVETARAAGDSRLEMLVQTVCSTGIRVSEVRAITVESLRTGQAEIRNKGRVRVILLPKRLCAVLLKYCRRKGISQGQVFMTRSGLPLDRSNIWKMMKRLAVRAKVVLGKVFPHNLRHLFARTYYKAYKDIVRLADILGHASIDTTRIYTMRSGTEQRRQIERLLLLI